MNPFAMKGLAETANTSASEISSFSDAGNVRKGMDGSELDDWSSDIDDSEQWMGNAGEASLDDWNSDISDFCENLELDRTFNLHEFEIIEFSRRLPANGGCWEGEPGNSDWIPDRDHVPGRCNPEGKTMGEMLDENGIDRIPFKDGFPDFSEVAEETVEIDHFSEKENPVAARMENYGNADKALAEKWNQEKKDGRDNWTSDDIAEYRDVNKLTWHECQDLKTIQLVPRDLHAAIDHRGGISVMLGMKKDNGGNNENV